jgi:GTP-binding protein HflX
VAVSEEFSEHLRDLFGTLGHLHIRRMFGGAGLFIDDAMIALVADEIIYMKVGFIADLPTDLVAAFRATLEEVTTAALVIHVRDVAHAESAAQRSDVLEVLTSLDLQHLPDEGRLVEFWNKLDLLGDEAEAQLRAAAARSPDVLLGSARTGAGIDELLGELDRRLAATELVVELELDATDGARLAWLYRHGKVLARSQSDGRIHLKVALLPPQHGRLARDFPPDAVL